MILAIDQGTTGTTCLVFDAEAELVGRAYREFAQHFPQPGWVEHDAAEIWQVTREVAGEALDDAGVAAGRAHGRRDHEPARDGLRLGPGRPASRCTARSSGRTAAPPRAATSCARRATSRSCATAPGSCSTPTSRRRRSPGCSSTSTGSRERAREGRAIFGTIDSWLALNLTGEHVTDPSNASRTMLYDLRAGDWSEELCELFGVPPRALPEVRPSIGEFGRLRGEALPGHDGVPLAGIAGDQQSALYGQACLDPGEGKNTYGTGSFVLVNTGGDCRPSAAGTARDGRLVDRAAHDVRARGVDLRHRRGGAVAARRPRDHRVGGARREALAASLDGNDGVYFVPALTGLGSPHWDPYARGTIVGLTRGTGRAHIARATLEAIAYQTVDAVRAIEAASGQPLRALKADGGATANAWLMQFQADVLGVPVVVPEVAETTALGAALLAGVGAGVWTQDRVAALWRERARYEPRMGADERAALLAGWARALERSRGWAQDA